MKATDLLERQHREVEKLFQSIKATGDETAKKAVFVELASSLVAHDAIERELFYPACEKKLGMIEILGESLVEHGLVEFSLYQAAQAFGENDFDFKMTVLEEVIGHHVDDEEDELFPMVDKAFESHANDQLGAAMSARFEQVKGADYRAPLLDNLRQVLDGAIKTKKNGGATKKAHKKSTSKHAHN